MTGMMLTITIDGKKREVELTPNEMERVYREVLNRTNKELIRDAINDLVDEGEMTAEQAEQLNDDEVMQDMVEDYVWETEDDEHNREIAKDIVWRYAD